MKRKITHLVALLLTLTTVISVNAQQKKDPIMFEIGGQKIPQSEFRYEFLRSIGQDTSIKPTSCTYEKRQALEEYVQLFANYRVKLMDAHAQGYDTASSLLRELASYRRDLAAPYLIDSATLNQIYREAYERNQYTVHAAHILVRVSNNAAPGDTMAAYNKAMDLYKRARAGEDFGKLAIKFSDDPSAKDQPSNDGIMPGNAGDLGFFSVFNMVYPFETACYNLEVDSISLPVRTTYGYHIIKLLEKRPFFGTATIQHIWVSNSSKNPGYAAEKIKQAFQQLQDGEDFARVCKNYSDDLSTSSNGGLLPNVSISQLPNNYVSVISQLTEGQSSYPFETSHGWHIVKLVKKDTLPSLEMMIPSYNQKLARDQRNTKPRTVFAQQCKNKYGFHDYTTEPVEQTGKKRKNTPVVYKASLDQSVAALNDSIYRKKWIYSDTMITDLRPIMSIAGIEYTQRDFLRWMAANQIYIRAKGDIDYYCHKRYKDFCDEKAIEYADSQLEKEHPEFASLLQEYHNGLTIFAYNDHEVWSKAILDTAGLAEYYAIRTQEMSFDNPEDEPYFWNTRARVNIINVSDSQYIAPEKARKVIAKAYKKGLNSTEIDDALSNAHNKKWEGKSATTVHLELLEMNHQNILRSNEWREGTYTHPNDKGYTILVVEKVYDPCIKTAKEARGYYINDYQSYLDKQLIERLRKQYNVIIHQDVVDEFTY